MGEAVPQGEKLKILSGIRPTLKVRFERDDGPIDLSAATDVRSWYSLNRGRPIAMGHSLEDTNLESGLIGALPEGTLDLGSLVWCTLVRMPEKGGQCQEYVCMGYGDVVRCEDMNDGGPKEFRERLCLSPEPQLPVKNVRSLKGVVAGWPRSGTTWVADGFRRMGIVAGHESYFRLASELHHPGRAIELDVSGFIAPYMKALETPKALIVRQPQDLFGSILGKWGDQMGNDPVRWMCDRWVESMRFLKAEADFWLKVEYLWEDPSRLEDLADRLGFEVKKKAEPGDIRTGKSTATEVRGALITDEARELAEEFGYSIRE